MSDWDGLVIPTFFVNRIVSHAAIGPCVKVFYSAVGDDLTNVLPEVALIWPIIDWQMTARRIIGQQTLRLVR